MLCTINDRYFDGEGITVHARNFLWAPPDLQLPRIHVCTVDSANLDTGELSRALVSLGLEFETESGRVCKELVCKR